MTKEKGITLIALVITIIILIILAGISIRAIFGEEGLIENAKMSAFATEFRQVQDKVEIYADGKIVDKLAEDNYNIANIEILPITTKLNNEEILEIENNNTTLKSKVEELSGRNIEEANLYWIDLKAIEEDVKSKYIIDIDTRQIYRYTGKKIKGKMWHTLDQGVGEGESDSTQQEDEIWDGWIKLTLYYPSGATEKQWRLGEEGETRYDENLMWQDYTGPITVKLSDVENVWIKYNLNGQEQIIAPNGRVVVDIQPDSYYPTIVDKVKIKIVYDENAEIKQYKIGNGSWQDYTEEFYVTENTIVEARAQKKEKISDSEGNIIGETETWGRDNVYIGNIKIEETELEAPTITRKEADTNVEGEVAKVEITYPEEAAKKIYKINYGLEQEYTEELSIKTYGTYIIAYYYDTEGNRSKSKSILINDTSSEEENKQQEYNPNRPGKPGSSTGSNPTEPTYVIKAPTITTSPTTVTTGNVVVRINVPSGYTEQKIYYKIGNGSYQEYTTPFAVSENTKITAYYVTTAGENSSKAVKRINNIKEEGLPYVAINLKEDPYIVKYGQESVTATILTSDATNVYYSTNGITYTKYTEPVKITSNLRFYAKAVNELGEKIIYEDITNIGKITNTDKITKLNVSIDVTPDPDISTELVEKAKITITYDEKATEKYYKIGEKGELKKYTEPFEITSNCTIYAYAISENGKGSTYKQIDNLTTGIAEPSIIASPTNNRQASKVAITIKFDKNANITRYEINNGSYTNYSGPITVEENCTITAYNKNSLGYEATSTYTVENIIESTTVVIDKGKYYIIKLNYPEGATGKEYKMGENAEWTNYKEDGILLIKPEYKDEMLNASGELKIKIEDDTGKEIDFKGDYYFITDTIQNIMANISMRWDRTTPQAPTIIPSTTEPAKELQVSIVYSNTLIVKQYKVITPDGETTGWLEYEGPIKVTQKGTVIYARGQDDAEVWSEQAMKVITNIDEEPPVIKVTADLETAKQKVGIKVEVTDDTKVETVKYAKGIQKESYFTTSGTGIQNNSVFYITENGYYTIYAQDGAGNTSTYTIEVTNIDLEAPEIEISISPDNKITTEVQININYGDSTTQQYKIGENNTTWSTYTDTITLTSDTVIAKGWGNSDGTITVYAKGTDTAGNEQIVAEKILTLDIDAPAMPVIESNYGYPILTEYGVKVDGATTITYDTRNDITNLYSIDNGKTWQEYTGKITIPGAGTIIAKSVKASGLETIATKTIDIPSDALGVEAYDGESSTGTNTAGYIYIDESMLGRKMYIRTYTHRGGWYIYFYDKAGNQIENIPANYGYSYGYVYADIKYTIPENTEKI